jgi:cytochrome c oxidase cbb3-type subunit 3
MNKLVVKKVYLIVALLLVSIGSFAQEAAGVESKVYDGRDELIIGATVFVGAIFTLILATLLFAVFEMGRVINGYYEKDAVAARAAEAAKPKPSFWTRINTRLNDAVPLDREEEVLTDHEYDGIHELDNNLPPWWKAMFYATIVFAVFYLAAFHWWGWFQPQSQEYQAEMLEARLEVEAYLATKANAIDETNVELDLTEPSLTEGSTLYTANCAACHASDLGGGVGPNLTDAYWIHGGGIKDVFKTVKNGVPQKGMISWKGKLSPQQMQRVASYVLSMQGSTPANPKEPEGDLYDMNVELKERAIEAADSAVIE